MGESQPIPRGRSLAESPLVPAQVGLSGLKENQVGFRIPSHTLEVFLRWPGPCPGIAKLRTSHEGRPPPLSSVR